FAEYVRTFGGSVPVDAPTMAVWSDDPQRGEFWTFPLAIKGFFDNGGQRIYVRRVTARNAKPAATTLGKGVMARVTADGEGSVLKLSSLIGISVGSAMTAVTQGNTTAITVKSYDNATGAIAINETLPKFKAGRDFVIVAPAAAGAIK